MHGMHGLGFAHAFGRNWPETKAAWKNAIAEGEQSSRGARVVARHDRNEDGKLGIDELEGTRLGARMSVNRFARLDANEDGLLDAAEIDSAMTGRQSFEIALMSQMGARFDAREGNRAGAFDALKAHSAIARLLAASGVAGTAAPDEVPATGAVPAETADALAATLETQEDVAGPPNTDDTAAAGYAETQDIVKP